MKQFSDICLIIGGILLFICLIAFAMYAQFEWKKFIIKEAIKESQLESKP